MLAKKVYAIVEDCQIGEDSRHQYPAWEFENGLLLVPSDTTHDYFFESWNEFQGNGNDFLVDTEETEVTLDFSKKLLNSYVVESAREFGSDSIPWEKILELRSA